jgi:hypothetical protein
LALIFDVGYFGAIDINLFTNFSISEHFLFSVEALPTALLVVFAFLGIYFLMKLFLESAAFRKNMTTKKLRFLYLLLLGFLIVFSVVNNQLLAGSVATAGQMVSLDNLFTSGWVVSAIIAAECILRRQELRTYILIMAACSIIYSFMLGYAAAGDYVSPNNDKKECFQELTVKYAQVLHVKIIRSGERGVLFFDLGDYNVQFRKWDDIEKISAKPKFYTRCM